MTVVRIVLDTNVFISCIGKNSPFRWIFDGILEGRFELCVSHDILLEYEEVLERRTTPEIAENVVNFLSVFPFVDLVEIFYNWQLVESDPEDNKFVDCMIAANALCIVSNDKHFQPYRAYDFPPTKVLTTDEFTQEFR